MDKSKLVDKDFLTFLGPEGLHIPTQPRSSIMYKVTFIKFLICISIFSQFNYFNFQNFYSDWEWSFIFSFWHLYQAVSLSRESHFIKWKPLEQLLRYNINNLFLLLHINKCLYKGNENFPFSYCKKMDEKRETISRRTLGKLFRRKIKIGFNFLYQFSYI